jgi:hypothetical protein
MNRCLPAAEALRCSSAEQQKLTGETWGDMDAEE